VNQNLTQPDWFDRLWDQIKPGLNPLFRANKRLRKIARLKDLAAQLAHAAWILAGKRSGVKTSTKPHVTR
jgi:hypothetical protein